MWEDDNQRQRVLLVGVDTGEDPDFERSMQELKSLAEACDMETAGIITQKMDAVNKALYIGTGKVREVKEFAGDIGAQIVCFDNALSPSQIRNLGDELELPIIDRTNLILDIFATRAQTREAKLQVETARLQYLLPRLVGMRDSLSRQGGASGSMSNKGAGEKKLELDRRKIEHRLAQLRRELEEVSKDRQTQRKQRANSGIPRVALVGYTNAGKSTMMNKMLETYGGPEEKQVMEKDMLFATLETTVRNIKIDRNRQLLLSDTVGFINHLPHGLVKAFRSTLEEACEADLILNVIDASDLHHKQHIKVTEDTLKDLNVGDVPMIYIYNKADKCIADPLPVIRGEDKIYLSAKSGEGLQELIEMIFKKLHAGHLDAEFLVPYTDGRAVSDMMQNCTVYETSYEDGGTKLKVRCEHAYYQKYKDYLV
jgi:GTP-binding protein HflX